MQREQHHSSCHGGEVSAVRKKKRRNPLCPQQCSSEHAGSCLSRRWCVPQGQGSHSGSVLGSFGWSWLVLTHVKDNPRGWGWIFSFINKGVTFVLGKRETFTKKPPCPCQDEQADSQLNTINTDASIMTKLSFALSPCPCLPVSLAHHKFRHLHQGCSFIHEKLKIYSLQDKTPKYTRLQNTDVYSDWKTQWPRKPSDELSFLIKQTALPCHVD